MFNQLSPEMAQFCISISFIFFLLFASCGFLIHFHQHSHTSAFVRREGFTCHLCDPHHFIENVLMWLWLFAMTGRRFRRVPVTPLRVVVFACGRFSQHRLENGTESGRQQETVTGEWGHFPWKEIKVKRMINVLFPASWFVFWTEIPLFLSIFAETTIAPLPVLLTVTLKTPFLGGAVLLQQLKSSKVTIGCGKCWRLI